VGHASDSFLLDNCLLGSMRGGGGENLDKKKKRAKKGMIQVDERGIAWVFFLLENCLLGGRGGGGVRTLTRRKKVQRMR